MKELQRRHVLVLEDEPLIVEVLESYLRRGGFETTLCGTVEEAFAALHRSQPDVMILDVSLPDGSGLDVLRETRSSGSMLPTIVLTAFGEESDRIVGLELGADDYVTKPFSPRELLARVRALLRRVDERSAARDGGGKLRIGELEIDQVSRDARIAGMAAKLTATEFRILAILAGNPGEVFTRAELLDRLQDGGKIYERTLDRHINNLRRKIERDSRDPAYVLTVYGVGYRLKKP